MAQFTTLTSSFAALPSLKAGLLPWRPSLAPAAARLASDLADAPPEAFAAAVEAETRHRLDLFLTGIQHYRGHPYARTVPPVPVAWQKGAARLLDYGRPDRPGGPPVLLVPSLINRAYILDLSERKSFARSLAAKGLRPFLLDWGAPGPDEAGFGLDDYVGGVLLPALQQVAATHGPPVLIGYCMGGMLALAAGALRPDLARGLVLMATPWDFSAGMGPQARLIRALEPALARAIDEVGELPVDILQMLFTAIDPPSVWRKFSSFAGTKRRSAKARDFVALEDWLNDGVPLAAGVARECLFGWYGRNDPAEGRWRVLGQPIDPACMDLPTLALVADRDRIVPPASSLALAQALPNAKIKTVPFGHIGMVTGRRARSEVWTPMTKYVVLVAQHVHA